VALSGGEPVLVVIDMQAVFGNPSSPWFTPGFPDIEPTVARLVASFGDRVVFTRFVAPEVPTGSWVPYYEQWPFALVPASDPLYDLVPAMLTEGRSVVSEKTFGKWGADLVAATGGSAELVLVGVSTDCCVLSTALAAADAGIHLRVVQDACAGLSEVDHRRALEAMALYAPFIEIVDSDSLVPAAV
jgi:nicotinamidase-related amidase